MRLPVRSKGDRIVNTLTFVTLVSPNISMHQFMFAYGETRRKLAAAYLYVSRERKTKSILEVTNAGGWPGIFNPQMCQQVSKFQAPMAFKPTLAKYRYCTEIFIACKVQLAQAYICPEALLRPGPPPGGAILFPGALCAPFCAPPAPLEPRPPWMEAGIEPRHRPTCAMVKHALYQLIGCAHMNFRRASVDELTVDGDIKI
jgi:hypothetical protein